MNKTQNAIISINESDSFNFEELEKALQDNLEEQFLDIEMLEEDRKKINNPDELGNTVMNVVWEQFINQIGVVEGEDFIKENQGFKLDLRNEAHIQTTENFAKGKLATHNSEIDYQERYKNYTDSFEKGSDGQIKTHQTRTGQVEANLVKGARNSFDKDRPTGSIERGTDMDHTVSAGEILRDPELNAHLTRDEQIKFANSDANLNEIDSSWNRSKSDLKTTEWLDNPNSRGQRPTDIFDISKKDEKKLREKDIEARKERDRRAAEGEQRSTDTGRKSQKQEAFRIGGKALRSVVMGLLAALVKSIIKKLIVWMRSNAKSLKTFFEQIKVSIKEFVSNLKQHLVNAADSFVTTIATSLFGPIIGLLKKSWILIKEGAKSIKDAIEYFKNPDNKNKPFSLIILEVSKILVVGLTAAGAVVLSEVIEKSLILIPGFQVPIPLFGSLANILGIFFGALGSGIIGALVLRIINKTIEKKQKTQNTLQQIEKKNNILATQEKLTDVAEIKFNNQKNNTKSSIAERHKASAHEMRISLENIMSKPSEKNEYMSENKDDFNNLLNDINNL